ncbi:hypothetical protein BDP81DRAFT_431616 [Colletotrichum phormii]|uniref:Uncharacterized protein n=1 Tax=Colletotrichum phormii TaxID=359342 RepID=A0AAI9ZM99_9PEZI|nr:uncharacterized protein BDP81DRAFT_431616 [Colletotrichum phormii]KAK1634602.1 hypothetical protein BDP81DRAFT_431616 [Colletotrichum phormii]
MAVHDPRLNRWYKSAGDGQKITGVLGERTESDPLRVVATQDSQFLAMILSETNHWAPLVDHVRTATLGKVGTREPPSRWVKWLQQTTHVMAFSDIASPGSLLRVFQRGRPSTSLWDLDRGLRCFRIPRTDITSAIARVVPVTPPPRWAAGPAPRCFDIIPTSGMTLRRNTNFVATRCG